MATHSSILAWKIPWTEEPGGLQSIGSERVRNDSNDLACRHPFLGASQLASVVKKSARQCRKHKRHRFDPWVRKIPWKRAWQSTPVFLPGEFHEQRNLVGYGPWDRREWGATGPSAAQGPGRGGLLCPSSSELPDTCSVCGPSPGAQVHCPKVNTPRTDDPIPASHARRLPKAPNIPVQTLPTNPMATLFPRSLPLL